MIWTGIPKQVTALCTYSASDNLGKCRQTLNSCYVKAQREIFPALFASFCKLGHERDIRIQIKNFIHGCIDLQIAVKSSEERTKDIPVTLRTSAPTTTSSLSAEKRTVPRVSVTRNPLVRHSNRSFPATDDVSGYETWC